MFRSAVDYARRGLARAREGKLAAAFAFSDLAWVQMQAIQSAQDAAFVRRYGHDAFEADPHLHLVIEKTAIQPLNALTHTLRERMRRDPKGKALERYLDLRTREAHKGVQDWGTVLSRLQQIGPGLRAAWAETVSTIDADPEMGPYAKALIERVLLQKAAKPLGPREVVCWKCSGFGYLPWYAHYANGVCFGCGGTGREENQLFVTIEPRGRQVDIRLNDVEEYRELANRPDIRDAVEMPRADFETWARDVAHMRHGQVQSALASRSFTTALPAVALAPLFVPGATQPPRR